jgi:uncharacterized protein involved in exopolysaccharide biosynthesis
MTTIEIVGIILGSNVLIELVKGVFTRKQTTAGTIKLKNEAGQIIIEGELKVSEFYKKEWQELLERYQKLEDAFELKQKEHEGCRGEILILQKQYQELQRQFTLLKTQLKM